MPSPIARYLVVCPDGRVRHHGAFETKTLARSEATVCRCGLLADAHRLEQVRLALGFAGDCDFCGEWYHVDDSRSSVSEVGEFYSESEESHKIGHAQCGLDAGWEIA